MIVQKSKENKAKYFLKRGAGFTSKLLENGTNAKEAQQKQLRIPKLGSSGFQELSMNTQRTQPVRAQKCIGKRSHSEANLVSKTLVSSNEDWMGFFKAKKNGEERYSGFFRKGTLYSRENPQRKLGVNHSCLFNNPQNGQIVFEGCQKNPMKTQKVTGNKTERVRSKDGKPRVQSQGFILQKNQREETPQLSKSKKTSESFMSFIQEAQKNGKKPFNFSKCLLSKTQAQTIQFQNEKCLENQEKPRVSVEPGEKVKENDSICTFLERCLGNEAISQEVIFKLIEERQKEIKPKSSSSFIKKPKSPPKTIRNRKEKIQKEFRHNSKLAGILKSMLSDGEAGLSEHSINSIALLN